MVKKAFGIVRTTFIWLLVAFAVFMMIFTIISVTTFNRNDRNLFGYKAYIVNSDSMAVGYFKSGDLILAQEVNPSTLQEGDIISYISQSPESFGGTITHKIRRRTVDAEGNPGFITYGTTTNVDDEIIVTYPYVLGKYRTYVPKLGTFFNFLKTTPGYFVCIFVPFMLLILYQGIKFVHLFRRYKREQMEELETERRQIEEERRQSAEMLQQLQQLQAQLAAQQGVAAPTAETAPAAQEEAPADAGV